jgi:trans-2,3-dihydro-3-hydroxyanthranilate isomerase
VPRSYQYLHYDVFTAQLFGGNQLAVFPEGGGLSDQTMQAIAREMNFSESTFVLPADRPDTDVRMRIFNPAYELPFAGHPTIGSTFALAHAGRIAPGAEAFVFGLGVGPIGVSLAWRDRVLSFTWMTQPLPTFGEPVANAARVAALLGLPEAVVAGTGLPAQVVSSGLPFLFVPLTTREAVDRAAVEATTLDAFFRATASDAHGVFVFSSAGGDDGATVYSRMFAPGAGIPEDPATGSASGPLGAYLVRHGVVAPERAGAMLSLQGVKMGRPSRVHISIGVDGGAITSVRVGGEAVLAGEGTLYV